MGTLKLTLHNLSDQMLRPTQICYTSLCRIDETSEVTGGTVIRNQGSFVALVPDAHIPAGGCLNLTLTGLIYGARTRSQGVLTAWIVERDGSCIEATLDDLEAPDGTKRGGGKLWPEGQIDLPLGLLPWPSEVEVADWAEAPQLQPAPGAPREAFQIVAALHRRLFPDAPAPFSFSAGRPVAVRADASLPAEGYRLKFTPDDITLTHHGEAAQQHGLIALAQIAHAARSDGRFQFPASGQITDAPRFGWRGLMLDVARNFHPVATHLRLLDIMAWLRMNRFHWHLIDDEGWRMPSSAYPALNTIGATRAQDAALAPQYRDGPGGQAGFFSADDIATVLQHAETHGINVMPEVEMPGHSASLIAAIPDLRDPQEPNGYYRSVQGFTNNALNPGLPRSYEVAKTLLDEAIDLFPFDTIHVGADEVDLAAWEQSPTAQSFAAEHGLASTHEMQAYFLRDIQGHLAARGRRIAAWDEAAEGGGILPDTALLFAWRSKEKTAELMAQGYDVVATPGQAYYLDMIESDGWDACGISWAGVSTPEACYAYDPGDGLPDGPGRLLGVQAAIWSEYLDTTARINTVAFPRLAAVAEAGWTPQSAKSWPRFAALSRLAPQL
ncbi:beta-N-acetylhexosaminidase [Candidatus Rhodobacter oscarellae]|uniref:beta-N-acetylhexosaminidase n=1 Tax=Candidatus Rhodobacter oscarellae TaxID=1675527 RepID=UPI001364AF80|nr:beta-N-acetylhexosaminidase [Candidatus Rhodobacter lobularis]